MKKAFHAFVKVRSSAELNLGWAGPGGLVIKRIFETGSESRQALNDFFHNTFERNNVIIRAAGLCCGCAK